jgi:hypothetical protein
VEEEEEKEEEEEEEEEETVRGKRGFKQRRIGGVPVRACGCPRDALCLAQARRC